MFFIIKVLKFILKLLQYPVIKKNVVKKKGEYKITSLLRKFIILFPTLYDKPISEM